MALFGGTKKNTKETKTAVKSPSAKKGIPSGVEYVLTTPRITEKAAYASERGVYVFNVANNATKETIAEAVKSIYKVTPVKVNISKVPAKKVFVRGNRGVKKGNKKAYVYLKKGDTIEII